MRFTGARLLYVRAADPGFCRGKVRSYIIKASRPRDLRKRLKKIGERFDEKNEKKGKKYRCAGIVDIFATTKTPGFNQIYSSFETTEVPEEFVREKEELKIFKKKRMNPLGSYVAEAVSTINSATVVRRVIFQSDRLAADEVYASAEKASGQALNGFVDIRPVFRSHLEGAAFDQESLGTIEAPQIEDMILSKEEIKALFWDIHKKS